MSAPMDPRCEPSVYDSLAVYITPPISLIGIVGHTLMLLTLRYGQLSDSPYVYLKCIALGSFFYEVVSLCEDPVYCPACQYSVETFYNLYVYQWNVIRTLRFFVTGWLVLLTLSMTVERFVYVRWPLQTRSLCTRERAKIICLATFLIALVPALFFPFHFKSEITTKNFMKPGVSLRTSRINCEPNLNTTSSENQFICFSKEFPKLLQSSEPSASCFDTPGRAVAPPQLFSTTNQSLFSLNCLHQWCRLPSIPKNLPLRIRPLEKESDRWRASESTYMNATLILWTQKDDNGSFPDFSPTQNFGGHAVLANDTCVFELEPDGTGDFNYWPSDQPQLKKYWDTVKCVNGYTVNETSLEVISNWFVLVWLYYLGPVFTGLMTVINVLIIIVLRRANRKAQDKVLSESEQNIAARRRADENRLTISLLALSSIRILMDILTIDYWGKIGALFHIDIDPNSPVLEALTNSSAIMNETGISLNFYLLAFMNRKFKQEFVERVLHGRFKLHRFHERISKVFASLSLKSNSEAATEVSELSTK